MVDNRFTYDSDNHLGYFNGKLIPSITQLLEIEYPLGNIDAQVLHNASERGTKIHNDIDLFNKGLINQCETIEGRNFIKLCSLFSLKVSSNEEQVLFYDENQEIVAYGTYDLLLVATDNSMYCDNGTYVLGDIKTTSVFATEKTSWQTSLYNYAKNMVAERVCGFWLRDNKAQLRPLTLHDFNACRTKLFKLIALWKEKQNGKPMD